MNAPVSCAHRTERSPGLLDWNEQRGMGRRESEAGLELNLVGMNPAGLG